MINYGDKQISEDSATKRSMDGEAFSTVSFLKSAYADLKFAPISQVAKCVVKTASALTEAAKRGDFDYEYQLLWGEKCLFIDWRAVLSRFGEVPVQSACSTVTEHGLPEFDYAELLSVSTRKRLLAMRARR